MAPTRRFGTTIGRPLALLAGALATGAAACSNDRVEPLAVTEVEPGVIELTTTCADGLHGEAKELADRVRIDQLEGDVIEGDCLGLLRIELDAPIGDRHVVVNGEQWVDLPETCPWGVTGPPDLGERLASCRQP